MNDGHSALFGRAVTEPGLSADFDLTSLCHDAPRRKSRSVAVSGSASSRITQDLPRGVVPRNTGDAAAGMRPGAAHVKPLQRTAIIAVAEHGARRKKLVECQRAMKNITPGKTELALQIERREHAPRDDAGAEPRCIAVDGIEHQVRHLVGCLVP